MAGPDTFILEDVIAELEELDLDTSPMELSHSELDDDDSASCEMDAEPSFQQEQQWGGQIGDIWDHASPVVHNLMHGPTAPDIVESASSLRDLSLPAESMDLDEEADADAPMEDHLEEAPSASTSCSFTALGPNGMSAWVPMAGGTQPPSSCGSIRVGPSGLTGWVPSLGDVPCTYGVACDPYAVEGYGSAVGAPLLQAAQLQSPINFLPQAATSCHQAFVAATHEDERRQALLASCECQ
jgi:hypothetical protein